MSLDDQQSIFKVNNGNLKNGNGHYHMTRSMTEYHPNGSASPWIPSGTVRSISASLLNSPDSRTSTPPKTKEFATISGGSSLSKQIKSGRLPVPQRTQDVFTTCKNSLSTCIEATEQDINQLKSKMDLISIDGSSPSQSRVFDVEKQMRAAERYSKRIEYHRTKLEELHEQYQIQMRLQQGVLNMQSAYGHQNGVVGKRKSSIASSTAAQSLRGGVRQVCNSLNAIENELEAVMGTLNVELRGIVGFARITPGDVFDVHIKHGNQKWKTRGKTQPDKNQQWDKKHFQVKCLLDDPLEMKVCEVKMFGKSKILTEQSFDPIQLFAAQPQLLTINLNSNGSLKLQMVITWHPVQSGPVYQPTDSPWSMNGGSTGTRSTSSSSPKSIKKTPQQQRTPILPQYRPISVYYNGVFEEQVHPQKSKQASCKKVQQEQPQPRIVKPTIIQPRPKTPNRTPVSTPKQEKKEIISMEMQPLTSRPALVSLLRSIKPLIQRLLGPYPELNPLEGLIFQLDSLVKRQYNKVGNGVTANVRRSLNMENGSNESKSGDYDELDDNVIMTTNSATCGRSPMRNGQSDFVLQNGDIMSASVGPSERRFRQIRHDRRKSLGAALDWNSDNNGNAYNTGSLDRKIDRPIGTTGHAELDRCICHHIVRCEISLKSLETVYGPLQFKEELLLRRLDLETKILSDLLHIIRTLPDVPNLSNILLEQNASIELQDVWLTTTLPARTTLIVSSRALRQEICNAYGRIIYTRYPDLVDKVFDSLMLVLTDRNTWEPEIISVYQFVECFSDKNLTTFIESLGHEAWITSSLETRLPPTVQYVIERLKQVPVVPPIECLRQIGMILVDSSKQMKVIAEMYLLRAQGDLRHDMISAFLTLLEHEDTDSRRGACRALAVLDAGQCIRPLGFVARCDRKAAVREEARRALTSFGQEGLEAIDATAFDTTRI